VDRGRAARYGLSVADVQQVVATAVGGMNVTATVEGLERYPVNLRYPQDFRDSPEQLALLPIVTPAGARLALGDVADIRIESGPPGIKSENARTNGWTFVDIEGVDLGRYVQRARETVAGRVELPPGYSLSWSGQFEYMERAKQRLAYVVPLTLAIIVVLLYLAFRRWEPVVILVASLPLALVGSFWLLYLMDYNLSVAVGVGMIALAGVAVETGVIMLVYLEQASKAATADASSGDWHALETAILDGASKRVRPVVMTASATVAGLLPILVGSGTGSEIMSRLAAPMVGGMISAVLLTLLVLPVIYLLWLGNATQDKRKQGEN
jgi:Cu(I)/Ag(I) efflux system membrane protein CusA/SilA